MDISVLIMYPGFIKNDRHKRQRSPPDTQVKSLPEGKNTIIKEFIWKLSRQ